MTRAKQYKPQWESVLFQPVLKTYPTRHSQIITAHKSLGDLNKELCMFNHQKALAHELQFASNFMLNALLGEFSNIHNIYQMYEPTIQAAIQLLRTEPVLDKLTTLANPWPQKSLLHFLGDALHSLTGMATTKDILEIKWQMISLIQEQTQQ